MQNALSGKHIVLCVCGGIAAYKSVELLRLFQKAGAEVKIVMTGNAEHFVGSMTFEAISGHPVFNGMYGGTPKNLRLRCATLKGKESRITN